MTSERLSQFITDEENADAKAGQFEAIGIVTPTRRKRAVNAGDEPYYNVAEPNRSDAKPTPKVNLRRASSIKMEPIIWLWHEFVARAKFHILGGDAGAGKTTLACGIGAIITNGGTFPCGSKVEPANVIIWSGEDKASDTLIPRFAAAGADMDRVFVVGPTSVGDTDRPFDPAKDLAGLDEAIKEIGGAALLIIDPISEIVTGDSHKNTETRRALAPVVSLAEKSGAAVLGITHFTKGTGGRNPVERIVGSLAFGAVPRVVFVAAKEAEPLPGETQKRVFTRAKSNIGPDGGGFEYTVDYEPLADHPDIVAAKAVFGDLLEGTARQILDKAEAVEGGDGERKGQSIKQAIEFLRAMLADGEYVLQKDIEAAAKDNGISYSTLKRAKKELDVKSRKFNEEWKWRLPAEYAESNHTDDEPQSSQPTDGSHNSSRVTI